jgi:hypothetical protein
MEDNLGSSLVELEGLVWNSCISCMSLLTYWSYNQIHVTTFSLCKQHKYLWKVENFLVLRIVSVGKVIMACIPLCSHSNSLKSDINFCSEIEWENLILVVNIMLFLSYGIRRMSSIIKASFYLLDLLRNQEQGCDFPVISLVYFSSFKIMAEYNVNSRIMVKYYISSFQILSCLVAIK